MTKVIWPIYFFSGSAAALGLSLEATSTLGRASSNARGSPDTTTLCPCRLSLTHTYMSTHAHMISVSLQGWVLAVVTGSPTTGSRASAYGTDGTASTRGRHLKMRECSPPTNLYLTPLYYSDYRTLMHISTTEMQECRTGISHLLWGTCLLIS